MRRRQRQLQHGSEVNPGPVSRAARGVKTGTASSVARISAASVRARHGDPVLALGQWSPDTAGAVQVELWDAPPAQTVGLQSHSETI